MKKILLFIVSVLMSCSLLSAAGSQQEVHVTNVAELIKSLGSDRIIIIDWDIDFDNELDALHNFNPQLLPEDDKYDQAKTSKMQDRCFIYQNTDGPELILAGFHNLTIRTDKNSRTRSLLRVRPRYAYVLNFVNCSDITLQSLVMGHTDEGTCDGGVLSFEHCKNIRIDNCDLYGCGTEGIGCHDTEHLTMVNSFIRDCSYQIMTLRECKDFTFDRCFFFRNRQFTLLDVSVSENLTFRDCVFTHNEGTLFGFDNVEEVLFERCSIMHAIDQRGNEMAVRFRQCTWSDAFGVKRDD